MTAVADMVMWKLGRSRDHSLQIRNLINEFRTSPFCKFALSQDPEGRLVLSYSEVDEVTPFLSVLIGEFAHNLRSSLDHLIFALATPTRDQEHRVQFPLCKSRGKFNKCLSEKMPGVSPDVQSIVESVQPYHRDICAGAGFLEKLQVLNNWDKHRAFTTCAALISETDIQLSVTGATTVLNKETFTGPAEKGRMVARITVGQSEKGARIAPHPSFHMQLVFADNMPAEIRGERPLDVLSPAAQFIDDDLLPRLLPYL